MSCVCTKRSLYCVNVSFAAEYNLKDDIVVTELCLLFFECVLCVTAGSSIESELEDEDDQSDTRIVTGLEVEIGVVSDGKS